MSEHGSGELLPQHAKLIQDSAIDPEVARERGYRSVKTKAELKELGFGDGQRRVPALLIPVLGVTGEIVSYQIRPDEPRIDKRGRPVKYETPKGSRMVLDVPPQAREWIGDPNRPLLVTEGIRKADSAVSLGLCCIAVIGVWNYRGTNEHGGKVALADWEYVALNGRQVYVCYDSDVMLKPEVHKAMSRLAQLLEQRGAHVAFIYLPPGDGGAKIGLDDFLAASHGVDDLFRLVSPVLIDLPGQEVDHQDSSYLITGQAIVWRKPNGDGYDAVRLTNFSARVVCEIVEDDGVEFRRQLEIQAICNGRDYRFLVPIGRFAAMNWPIEEIGISAIVQPGIGLKDRARVAIQELSRDAGERRVYTHTGWRKLGEDWVYFHGGGGIGAEGAVPGLEVRLPDALDGFRLPDPPDDDELKAAVRSSLQLLDVAPDEVTVPLFASIWLAAALGSDMSIHLVGTTGTGKSELAALAQQHWGAGLDARHLPASWSSTDNALVALAFAAKEAIMVVDDFLLSGTVADIARMHLKAEHLLRAQGNLSGRQRMRADTSLRAAKPPRGLIVSTGEDVPRGESLRSRMVVIEVAEGAVYLDRLTRCQQHAAGGLYAAAMSAFLRWFAPIHDSARDYLDVNIRYERDHCPDDRHPRATDNIGKLRFGIRTFLAFAAECGAISEEEAAGIRDRADAAFKQIGGHQQVYRTAADPVERFLELIRGAIASGRAHVADPDGGPPDKPERWGWQDTGSLDQRWQPRGDRIGWIDGHDLYLEPQAAYTTAQRIARDGDAPLPVSPRTLYGRMREKGLLASTEPSRTTYVVRRNLQGGRRSVIHVEARQVIPPESDHNDHDDHPPDLEAEHGGDSGHSAGHQANGSDQADDHESPPVASSEDVVAESVVTSVTPGNGGSEEEWGITI